MARLHSVYGFSCCLALGCFVASAEVDEPLDRSLGDDDDAIVAAGSEPEDEVGGEGLPDKPSVEGIRTSLEAVRPQMSACARRFGVASGTSMQVKVRIAGRSGRVDSAVVSTTHRADETASCIVEALRDLQFERFRSPSVAVVVALDA